MYDTEIKVDCIFKQRKNFMIKDYYVYSFSVFFFKSLSCISSANKFDEVFAQIDSRRKMVAAIREQ